MKDAKSTDQEEAEELTFVPSAIRVPQKLMFRCDKQCSEKTLSFWQLASMVIQEGEESYTTNICQKFYNDSLKSKTLTNWQLRQFAGEKAHRGRFWKMGNINTCEECGNTFAEKEIELGGSESRLQKKSRQEHKVSGSWNRQPKSPWSK